MSLGKIFILPGGTMPRQMTQEAAGYDVYARAVVSPHERDPADSKFLRTCFDFKSPPTDPKIRAHIVWARREGGTVHELSWRLGPGETVCLAVGFVIELRFIFGWNRAAARSRKDSSR